MERCVCGANLAGGGLFCPVCHRRVLEVRAEELVDELNRSLRESWTPRETLTAPPPEKVYSRVRRGPLSFGPAVKIPLTILASLFMAAVLQLGKPWKSPEALVGFSVASVLTVVFLRTLWRRERIR
jgi:hypothetical protein